MNTAEKTCFKCGLVKSLADFYKHPRMADGHLGKCKECTKSDVQSNRTAKIDQYRKYDRDRASEPRRRSNVYRTVERHRRIHPERTTAHNAVSRALRSGVLIRPCACWYCGSDVGVVGHHADYSRPLAVSWLCQACHKEVHRMTDEILAEEVARQ